MWGVAGGMINKAQFQLQLPTGAELGNTRVFPVANFLPILATVWLSSILNNHTKYKKNFICGCQWMPWASSVLCAGFFPTINLIFFYPLD